MISPALSETQLPFGNDCYIAIEKWPIEIADLFQMMIFNSYVNVYQRVSEISLHPNWTELGKQNETNIFL
jgi:hypothetical protein